HLARKLIARRFDGPVMRASLFFEHDTPPPECNCHWRVYVIKYRAVGQGLPQLAPNCIDGSGRSDHGAEMALAFANPFLIFPIEADTFGNRRAAGAVQKQLA